MSRPRYETKHVLLPLRASAGFLRIAERLDAVRRERCDDARSGQRVGRDSNDQRSSLGSSFPHTPAHQTHAARCSHEAVPSHVWGIRSQHQPSFGFPSLIQNAGTRWSPRREPAIEKPQFLAMTSGC